jgi:alkylation response protein AidB-like acyl-CoA dehydrogenase
MTFVLTGEQESIRDVARRFARERAPVAHLRALRDAGDETCFSRALWKELADLGLSAMALPGPYGGGMGHVELGLVLEELGRTLAPTPILSTALLAGTAIALAGTPTQQEAHLPGVAAGDRVLALAHDEGSRHARYGVATRAERAGAGFRITGDKALVLDGHVADALVVVARTSGAPGERSGITLFLLSPGAPGLQVTRSPLVDSRGAARVSLRGVAASEAEVLGAVDAGADVLDRVLDRATVGLASEMLGGAAEVFEQTLAYLKVRRQFGVPIGSFQALKHRAALLFCEIELTRSVVMEARAALDGERPDASLLASAAKARATDTFLQVTAEAVQMHGGVGVTDELDVGLFLKRARVAEMTLGGAAYHRDRFATLSGY